jgi:hypothetical protein
MDLRQGLLWKILYPDPLRVTMPHQMHFEMCLKMVAEVILVVPVGEKRILILGHQTLLGESLAHNVVLSHRIPRSLMTHYYGLLSSAVSFPVTLRAN